MKKRTTLAAVLCLAAAVDSVIPVTATETITNRATSLDILGSVLKTLHTKDDDIYRSHPLVSVFGGSTLPSAMALFQNHTDVEITYTNPVLSAITGMRPVVGYDLTANR